MLQANLMKWLHDAARLWHVSATVAEASLRFWCPGEIWSRVMASRERLSLLLS